MIRPVILAVGSRTFALDQAGAPLDLDALLPGDSAPGDPASCASTPGEGPWEVELGFGKGRYLLRRAQEDPSVRFLGIEVVGKYQKMLAQRAARRSLQNLVTMRGEAVYLLSTVLPAGFADAVHVYFPDPWPKARHHKRRLFDAERVDLVLGLLRPGGRLVFATDFLEYGEKVQEILESHPSLEVRLHPEPWPDGARTNYEAKYMAEGRPVLRLEAFLPARPPRDGELLHPRGAPGILAAHCSRESEEDIVKAAEPFG